MTRRTARQISNLVIDEISLVDKGANQHAVVTIAKNADGDEKENEMDIFDEQGNPLDVADLNEGDIVYDGEGNAYAMELDNEEGDEQEFDDEQDDDVEKSRFGAAARAAGGRIRGSETGQRVGAAAGNFRRRVQSNPGFTAGANRGMRDAQRVRAGARTARANVAGAGGSVGRHVSSNRAAYGAGAGGAAVGALGGGGAVAYNNRNGVRKSYAEEVREELSKALTDAEREEVITKALGEVGYLAEELEISKAMAEEERELRLEREYTEIAKSYNLPFEDSEVGRVLKNCAETLSEEDCDIIHKAFSVAGEAIFEEYGAVGGGDNGDVYTQVESAIDDMVSKSGGSFNRDEAMAQFFYENPDAYDDYLTERGR